MHRMTSASELERFSISALAGIVGVPVETLRTWERRYGVPVPEREKGGRRQYTLAEVERLRIVVQLVHHGERVRDLAGLELASLAERLALHGGAEAAPPSTLRLVLLHPSPPPGLAGPSPAGRGRVEVLAAVGAVDELPPGLRPDALVVHASLLPPEPGALLDDLEERLDPELVIVLASFLPGATRRRLEARGARIIDEGARTEALRGRLEEAALAARVSAGARAQPAAAPPQALYTRAQLERLLNSPSTVQCECPAHLAGLILRLREFERFSRQCANDTPEQAALHGALGAGGAEAAAILEALLERVCAFDGVDPRA